MSSKTKKTTTTTTSSSSISTSSTPQQRSSSAKKSVTPTAQKTAASTSQMHTSTTSTTSSSGGISKSQISPTRYSRQHEKEELANLNDRLACYIERVRNLETENSRLTREIKTSQETVSREVNTVKTMYDRELTEARKLIDELSKEKARLEIDARNLYDDNEGLKTNLEKKSKECSLLQTNLALKESHLNDMTTKYNTSQQDRKKLQDENKYLEEERNRLAALVKEIRSNLEAETLSRIELENSLQGVREELAFKEQVYQQELMEVRTRRQEQEVSEIDGRLIEEYEERLYQSLQEIRDQYEIDLENNREEIKKLYEEKLKSLASQLSRNSSAASMALDEMKQMQQRMEDMNRRIADAEADKNFANQRARDLEKQLERLKSQYMEEFAKHDVETTRLREEMAHQLQEYQGLMDIKVALDLEIAAYRKLIEGEEARLKIPSVPSPPGRGTPQRAGQRPAKRRRMFREESEETMASNYSVNSKAKGDIELSEIDLDGKFVRLLNKGNKEVSVSGWQLVRKAGEAGTTSFKFHRSVKIEPGSVITVWSADVTDQPHEPPENIVMKGQKWFVADSMITSLLNSSGEEVAITEHSKQQSTSTISRQRGDIGIGGGQFGVGSYFQRTPSERVRYSQSPGRNVGEERCRIM